MAVLALVVPAAPVLLVVAAAATAAAAAVRAVVVPPVVPALVVPAAPGLLQRRLQPLATHEPFPKYDSPNLGMLRTASARCAPMVLVLATGVS